MLEDDGALRIAADLALPLELITHRAAIVAKTGMGKTYTGLVLLEQMIAAGGHVAVIDPLGVWWGARSSADGEGPGLPVLILGGDHGDVPLEPGDGAAVAEFIVDSGQSLIIDLSLFHSDEVPQFAAAFAETLFRLNRKALHLLIDEADQFAPQVAGPGEITMLRAFDRLARRGRTKGIGITCITQRLAAISKNVVSQIDMLVLLRMMASQDIKAVRAWVDANGTSEQREMLLSSLASLPKGTAWVYAPGWLGVFQQVKISQRWTFDSSSTPTVGVEVREPRRLADVDMGVLRERFGAARERAQTDDPKVLQERIAELERQLHSDAQAKIERVVEHVEVPVIDPAALAQLVGLTEELARVGAQISGVASALRDRLAQTPMTPVSHGGMPAAVTDPAPVAAAPVPKQERVSKTAPPRDVYKPGERRIMDALVKVYPLKLTRAQLATLSEMTADGGSFGSYYTNLRRRGLFTEDGGLHQATPTLFAYYGVERPAPRNASDLQAMWLEVLGRREAQILQTLLSVYPGWLNREEIAERIGMSAAGGSFGAHLGTLRNNSIIEQKDKQYRASPSLF